jgi:hypothetical protein
MSMMLRVCADDARSTTIRRSYMTEDAHAGQRRGGDHLSALPHRRGGVEWREQAGGARATMLLFMC